MIDTKTYEKIWVKIVAIALGLMGFINIISAWLSYDKLRFKLIKTIFDYQIIQGSRYLVVMTGIIALLIAPKLYRQKRIAWFISIALLAVSGIAHITKGADIEEACLCILLLGILMPLYRYCNVKSDPIRVQRSGKILLGAVIFVLLYTFIGLHFFANKLGLPDDLSVLNMGINALLFDVSKLSPQTIGAKFFADSILLVNSFAILTGLILALSPVIIRTFPEINLKEYQEAAKRFATQPIQIFTLSKDYMHFSKNSIIKEYLSYKTSNRVAMMVGNPCIQNSAKEITEDWINYSKERDWIPAVYQAQNDFVDILKEKGFYLLPIGVEALINLETFSLEGKEKQELRSAQNKCQREGWAIREFVPSDFEKVQELDKKWIKVHGNKEIGFAMGKLSLNYLCETRTVLLFDKDENLLAYLNNIELNGSNSRAVDLMRKNYDFNTKGVMEALFLNEILQAKADGKKYYDLGLSPLAEMDKSLADNKIAFNLLKLIYEKQNRYYDFKGLHHFKSKFSPEWHPSFLAYPSQMELPKILLALLNLNQAI